MAENEWKIKLNDYQDEFIFSDKKFHFLKSGWATGKSMALIMASMIESELYDKNQGVIFRKEYVDLRDSTIKDFEKYTGRRVDSSRNVVLENGSEIMFRHLEEIDNIQNMNLGWFGIEQAEEIETDEQFYFLFGRLRRQPSSLKGYVISNAKGHNWIWKIRKNGLYNLQGKKLDIHNSAKTFDNQHNLTPEFIESLAILKSKKPHLYARYVMNSDEEEDTVDIIIHSDWVRKAVLRKLYSAKRIVIACDPSWEGDDETVIYVMRGYEIVDQEIFEKKSPMETAGRLVRLKNKWKAGGVAIDGIGIGAGIVSRLQELGQEDKSLKVMNLKSSNKSSIPGQYRNFRAEMWEKAAEKFQDEKVSIPDDEILQEQLSIVRYKTIGSTGQMQVESKAEIKKRLKSSPDRADCYVMGLWAVDKVKPFIASYESEQIKNERWTY